MTVRIGKKLKKCIRQQGFTNAECAEKIGIGERGLYHYLSDQREPNLTTLKKIAEVLDVSLDELLDVQRSKRQ